MNQYHSVDNADSWYFLLLYPKFPLGKWFQSNKYLLPCNLHRNIKLVAEQIGHKGF